MDKRLTIIDFVEKYTRQFAANTFLREKVDGVWTETSFEQTRKEAYRIGAGLMKLGLQKGDKVSLLSEGRRFSPPSLLFLSDRPGRRHSRRQSCLYGAPAGW